MCAYSICISKPHEFICMRTETNTYKYTSRVEVEECGSERKRETERDKIRWRLGCFICFTNARKNKIEERTAHRRILYSIWTIANMHLVKLVKEINFDLNSYGNPSYQINNKTNTKYSIDGRINVASIGCLLGAFSSSINLSLHLEWNAHKITITMSSLKTHSHPLNALWTY